MYNKNVSNDEKIKKVVSFFLDWKNKEDFEENQGDTIYYQQIETIINVKRRSSSFNLIMGKAKEELMTAHHIHVETVRKSGYRILPPNEAINAAIKHFDRAKTQINIGEKTMKYLPYESMDDSSRIRARNIDDRITILNAQMKGLGVEFKSLVGKQKRSITVLNS